MAGRRVRPRSSKTATMLCASKNTSASKSAFDRSLIWRTCTRQAAEQLYRELSERQEVELGPADPATQRSQYHCAVLCEQVCGNATPVWR